MPARTGPEQHEGGAICVGEADEHNPTRMAEPASRIRSHVTLALCTILHAFTHAYGTLLVPLYLLVRDDLRLPGVSRASMIVTVYGLVYCLGSYTAGVMADRWNRKALLGVGLL